MKISELTTGNNTGNDSVMLLEEFNNTQKPYPEKTIQQLFREIAGKYPSSSAITFLAEEGDSFALPFDITVSLSYQELDERSGKLAAFLSEKGAGPGTVTAILLNRSADMIVAMLGILKSGSAYLPVDPELPLLRQQALIDNSGATILISEKAQITTANTFLWQCNSLHAFLCIDSAQVHLEKERQNELMRKDLWNYVGERSHDTISGGGWINSYTGEDFSAAEMNEYSENVLKKLDPYLSPDVKVLEIGCSSGITLFKIAPRIGSYYAIDLSEEILRKTASETKKRGLTNVTFKTLAAHELGQVDEKDFDIVIINSVVQCFSGYNYLRNVITQALELAKDKAILFMGDIMDAGMKQELIRSIQDYSRAHVNAKAKLDFSNELFVPRKFFDELKYTLPGIVSAEHSDKIHTLKNELTSFRYDSIIRVEKTGPPNPEGEPSKMQYGKNHLEKYPASYMHEGQADDAAYVIYTSGTTGMPKGVTIRHKSVVNLVHSYFTIDPGDRVAQLGNYNFDLSVIEIFPALLNGAHLLIPNQEIAADPKAFGKFLVKQDIHITYLHRSYLEDAQRILAEQDGISLKKILIGVEPILYKSIQWFISKNIRVKNGYGPTESTVCCTILDVEQEHDQIGTLPIGKPLGNTQIYILDEGGKLADIRTPGEICIGGDGLAKGYLNDPVLTAQKFIPNPFKTGELMYRTGDLGRWRWDGNLEFIGRKDDQLKIRGFRIEPGEVQVALFSHPFITAAIALAYGNSSEEKELVAYYTSSTELSSTEVRSFLSARLPVYMIPSHLIRLENFQYTINGKIDKKALPAPASVNKDASAHYASPRNSTDEQLCAIWQEILTMDKIGIEDNFFELGGHSLKATQVVSRVHKELQVEISLSDVFTYPSVKQLSDHIRTLAGSSFAGIEPVPPQEHYELSHAQRRLWIIEQMEKGCLAYNMSGIQEFIGDFDYPAFRKAIEATVARHESLRTVFITVNGEPRQKINPPDAFELMEIDLSKKKNKEELIAKIISNESNTPFDLEKGPLLRARFITMDAVRHIFLFTLHHIISDGWSMKVLVQEMAALYQLFSGTGGTHSLPPLKIQYKDYAAWQNNLLSDKSEKHREYWQQKLAGHETLLLPSDFERPRTKSYKGGMSRFTIEAGEVAQLKSLAAETGTTLHIILVTMVKVLLHKYSGQKDILIGTDVSGRNHLDLEDQIGFYVNQLVLRTGIDTQLTFRETLMQVKQTILDAYQHQEYPFDKMISELKIKRDYSRNPLFDIAVSIQNIDVAGKEIPAQPADKTSKLQVINREPEFMHSHLDMEFNFRLTSENEIKGYIQYSSDIFTLQRIEHTVAGLKYLMQTVCNQKANSMIGEIVLNQYPQSSI